MLPLRTGYSRSASLLIRRVEPRIRNIEKGIPQLIRVVVPLGRVIPSRPGYASGRNQQHHAHCGSVELNKERVGLYSEVFDRCH
jgi:hypothetical protein